MAKIEKHIVQAGQSIYDICVQLSGSIDMLQNIMDLNPGLNIALLTIGQELLYSPEILNKEVYNSYISSGYTPATLGDTLIVVPPTPEPIGANVIINVYGGPAIIITAPNEITIAPSAILDAEGEIVELLGPDQTYSLPFAGIRYKRPIVTQYTSYNAGDVGWAYQNGYYDFSGDPVTPLTIQELDYTDTTNFFKKLKFNNAWGNKIRFTNSNGENESADGNITGISFVGALPNYIVDNLTGFAYCMYDTGSAKTYIATISAINTLRSSAYLGHNDWIPLMSSQIFAAFPTHNYQTQNPFFVAGFWLGETRAEDSNTAARFTTGTLAISSKSTATLSTIVFTRKHF